MKTLKETTPSDIHCIARNLIKEKGAEAAITTCFVVMLAVMTEAIEQGYDAEDLRTPLETMYAALPPNQLSA